MTETIKLTWEDICHHTPHCECKEWLTFTVPDYKTYHSAYHWLRSVRKQKAVSVQSVIDNGKYTGAFTFKFLCEREYLMFVLRWS